MRIRTIRPGAGPKNRNGSRRSAPSGVTVGAVATVLLAGAAWAPTARLARPQSHLTPAGYSMPYKNAAEKGETPAIKRVPVQAPPDPDATIRVDFSPSEAAPGRRQTKGKIS